ncbi:hypothetical protein GCM10027445_37780 [Amycolatopsis endophytica]|uniref:Uncharacterized protein n=1 Tax=Amycolatopsis endophytica TaxID=860233 RepID=A0A853B791_9PSEU|nr:hypothetical protein [Amycolatopsis endophytica]NYI90949.1 hypothetical protein [Amycolatopsis endophytica]
MGLLSRILIGLREFAATHAELTERQELRNRPWEEDFLHWSLDAELHGTVVPPPGRHSTTRSGWCPGVHRARVDAR